MHVWSCKRALCGDNFTIVDEKKNKKKKGRQHCTDKISFAATKLPPAFVATTILQMQKKADLIDATDYFSMQEQIFYGVCSCQKLETVSSLQS